MKPRTKLQHQVVDLSKHLHSITGKERKWAYEHCLQHIAYRNKSRTVCLDCGYKWKQERKVKTCNCPNCETKLSVIDTRNFTHHQQTYFAVIETIDGFQLNRYYELKSAHKVGEEVKYYLTEILQQWIREDGKYEFLGRRHRISWHGNSWVGGFEIRARNPPKYNYHMKDAYNINPNFIYPEREYLSIFERNGFTGNFHNIRPLDLFLHILKDNKAESLLKMLQPHLLEHYLYGQSFMIHRYWSSIRICQRNNYLVNDASMWFDYIGLLEVFRKDLHNPKYVCPTDLKQEHDRYVAKKRKKDREDKVNRLKNKIQEADVVYRRDKLHFFSLHFKDGELSIQPLRSVQEFYDEGEHMNHCLFSSEYYLRKESLILSATFNGERQETIEVSLKNMTLQQSNGAHNEDSPYHERIVKLVNKNMRKISKIARLLEKPEEALVS